MEGEEVKTRTLEKQRERHPRLLRYIIWNSYPMIDSTRAIAIMTKVLCATRPKAYRDIGESARLNNSTGPSSDG